MDYVVSCVVPRWKSGDRSVFVFGVDVSSHPWPSRDTVHVWAEGLQLIIMKCGAAVYAWKVSGRDSTVTHLVSHSLTLDSAVEAETGLRPSLYDFRSAHPFQGIFIPRAVTEERVLAGPEGAFQSLSCAADCSFWLDGGSFDAPTHQSLCLTDYHSDLLSCTLLPNTSYFQEGSLNVYSSWNMAFVITAALFVKI